jgi:indole-3-glycerol phosphate synthase
VAGGVNVIAECKRRSPRAGVLRPDYDAAAIACSYQAAGAAAISVLTEPAFFDGSLEDLGRVRAAVDVPLLRKDFIIDPYQVYEAAVAGADAVLLIAAVLTGQQLRDLIGLAGRCGLAVLTEIHDERELDAALEAGATIVGVNNRNLRTLRTDTTVSSRLAARLPERCIRVSESGLRSADDLRRLRDEGFHACLVGEYLMTAADPGERLRTLLASAEDPARRSDARGDPCT